MAIPLVLFYFARRRFTLPFRVLFLLFGMFITACGFTHLLGYYTFYTPVYRLDGLVKLLTALVSWATVGALIPATPRALAMRSPEELEREIAARKQAEEALRQANDALERRVEERTAELEAANQALQDEIAERKRAADALQQNQAAIETLNERLRRAMAESHHRIKNNLQGIAAIVEMQRAESSASVSPAALQRIEQHIVALAIIHDLLTQEAKSDAEFETLSLRAALDKLIPLLQATAGDRKIHCRIADLRLSIRQSASLALLINELVSNALKHSAGDIQIVVTADAESGRLEVLDEGPGFPPGFDPRQAANTGLELIESVSRWDLQGRVTYENRPEGGGRVVITFPLVPRAEQMPADR